MLFSPPKKLVRILQSLFVVAAFGVFFIVSAPEFCSSLYLRITNPSYGLWSIGRGPYHIKFVILMGHDPMKASFVEGLTLPMLRKKFPFLKHATTYPQGSYRYRPDLKIETRFFWLEGRRQGFGWLVEVKYDRVIHLSYEKG